MASPRAAFPRPVDRDRASRALLAEYKTSKEIASKQSVRTIENHRVNICNKLELHRSHALVKFAIEHKADW